MLCLMMDVRSPRLRVGLKVDNQGMSALRRTDQPKEAS